MINAIQKIDANTGDIIWKTVVDQEYQTLSSYFDHAILNNEEFLFPEHYNGNESKIVKLNSSSGELTTVVNNAFNDTHQHRTFEVDNNNNIYIGARSSTGGNYSSLKNTILI